MCVLGHHELDYPRNRSVQRLIRRAGYRVVPCHSRIDFPLRHASLLSQYLQQARDCDAIWVTEGGHRLVPLIKAAAKLGGKPVIFDPFTSRYNTRVEDRRMHAPRSYEAMVCKWQDWSSTRAADVLVFDTTEHRDYFARHYRPTAPGFILEVGVDESVFVRADPMPSRADERMHVLFYGTYIPLQGIEHIVDAATLLRDDPSIALHLIGRGQCWPEIDALLRQRQLPNLTTEALVPPHVLAQRIAAADVCLGIFAETIKAANVVANKVVQCAAVGRPIVTRRSPAIARYFEDGHDIVTVPPGDGEALAIALTELQGDRDQRVALCSAARTVFERRFSERALTRRMAEILDTAHAVCP